jgi:hypothetical protein
MKIFSILTFLLLTSCSSINFAKDEGLIKRDDVSEVEDNHAQIPAEKQ